MPARPAFDDFQRRHRWAGLPIAVVSKYVDDQGSYLAALITYYGFLSLFPLLLLAATILGFVLNGDSALQQQLLGSALSQFPIIGKQLTSNIHGYRGSGAGLVVGLLVALYGGLGIAQAGQNAMNVAWAVPRNNRPNPFAARLRSLALLATLSFGVLVTTALSAVGAVAHNWSKHQGLGATVSAVAWQILQLAGALFVAHELRGAQEVYGSFALVLGLIAWIYLEAVVFVMAAELNVVVRRRLWPRALMTPFTDDVDLTGADERAYGSYAKAQRAKGYEHIDVEFDPPTG